MNQPPADDQAKQPDKQQLQFLRGRARAFERSGMLESAAHVRSDIEALQDPEQPHRNAAAAKARQEEARTEQIRAQQETAQDEEAAQDASPMVEVGGIDALMASTPATARENDLYWFPRYV
ncbi:hypothetical protein ACTXMB_14435 [Arthrobacter rhombi]|uniref:hypothetical protein n=1 Tax=Arthrobacter rhombi TaxID=71253 RepID=UPI003FD48914